MIVVSLKSYGDFVIAVRAVGRLGRASDGRWPVTILAGRHLAKLGEALGHDGPPVEFIAVEGADVPAAFDVRKHGLPAAISSLIALRRSLRRAVPAEGVLVFDRLGVRERFLSVGTARGLAPSPNIHRAYADFFAGHGLSSQCPSIGTRKLGKRALIVPGSRIPRKVVPASVQAAVARLLAEHGIEPEILLLEGETVEVAPGPRQTVIPRSFESLLQSVRGADVILSADSLPAHLADFAGRPVFVLTPVPNEYWLPEPAFREQAWATFEDLSPLRSWLDTAPTTDGVRA